MSGPSHMIASLDAALAEYTAGIDRAVRFVTIDQVDMLAEFYLHNRRTPDPAQIRADALREAALREAAVVLNAQYKRALALSDKDLCHDGKSYAAAACGWAEQAILALIDTPPSPTAVDGSPAPDAGGKEGV